MNNIIRWIPDVEPMLDQRRLAHGHAGCLERTKWPRPGAGGGSESNSSRQHDAEKHATQTGGPAKLVAIAQKRNLGMHCNSQHCQPVPPSIDKLPIVMSARRKSVWPPPLVGFKGHVRKI